jgi:hypothetical protein
VEVVVTAGLTLRVAGLAETPSCAKPSDQTRFHGPEPVRATESVALSPAHTVLPPLTLAVGAVPPQTYVKPFRIRPTSPSGFSTSTSTSPLTCGPVTALMRFEATLVTTAGIPPMRTMAPAWKPDPEIVTGVPPREGPVVGEIDVGFALEVREIAVSVPSCAATKSVPSAIASCPSRAANVQTAS